MAGRGPRRPSRRALATYVAAWVAVGAAIALVAVALLDDGSGADGTLPPVRQPALESAAHVAGCRLMRHRSDGSARTAPAAAGAYDTAPDPDALAAALRRGTVVLRYRTGIADEQLEMLRTIQETIPRGTILTPGTSGMPYEVEISAYRRVLQCPRLSIETLDALRLFQGRYLGSGPGP